MNTRVQRNNRALVNDYGNKNVSNYKIHHNFPDILCTMDSLLSVVSIVTESGYRVEETK